MQFELSFKPRFSEVEVDDSPVSVFIGLLCKPMKTAACDSLPVAAWLKAV
jgi:hypothetical protein